MEVVDGCDLNSLDCAYVYNRNTIGIASINSLRIGIDIPPIVVINLTTRPDRANIVLKTMKSHDPPLPFIFYKAKPHSNPVRGCLESHINIVKWASSKKYPSVCIFEDDFVIQHSLSSVPRFPNKWDMIYLGGLCTHIKEWGEELPQTATHNFVGNKWIKGTFYCDHAYLVRNTVYSIILEEGWPYERELDRFYTGTIHDSIFFDVYMPYVQYVVQSSGWSDIDNKNKWEGWEWPKPGDMFTPP